ncbi:hypothetical protein PENTCL1PPCAC_16081, partial [Pristionchus entomophagus]
TLLPIISSLTVYPANVYLLVVQGSSTRRDIRTAYVINIIAHIYFDWIFAFFNRVYIFPPYGLYYCDGIIGRAGLNKRLIMGILASGIPLLMVTFYILMMRLHHLAIMHTNFRWRFSPTVQLVIGLSFTILCGTNLVAFVLFGADVQNYYELIKNPELAWLVERGGTLLLFSEPGIHGEMMIEIIFFVFSLVVFFPSFALYTFHSMIYLKKYSQAAFSAKTMLLTRRLLMTFSFQMRGATIFFMIPLTTIITMSHIDLSQILPGSLFAAVRFFSIVLLELNAPQFALVFILRNETHRQ